MDGEQLYKLVSSTAQPEGHLPVWRYLADQLDTYPLDEQTRPWRAARGSAPSRALAAAQIYTHGGRPLAIEVYSNGKYQACTLLDPTNANDSLARDRVC